MIKVLENLELEGTKLTIINAVYDKTLYQHHPKWRIEAIPLKSRARQKCPLSPLYIPYLWYGRIKIVKMSIFLKIKSLYISSVIPIETLISFFTEIEKNFLKFIPKHKRPQIAQTILR